MMASNGAFQQEKENERRLRSHLPRSVLLQAFPISDQFSKLVVDWDEKAGFPFPGP